MHTKNVLSPLFSVRNFSLFVLGLLIILGATTTTALAAPIRVVVWDEREAAQKTAYGDFLGNTLAAYLAKQKGMTVKSVGLDDPDQGLSDDTLNHCDVLIWWGHERHKDVKDEHVEAIMQRLKAGKLSLIALHSAHWSKPFFAAMNERAIEDALKTVPASERSTIKIVKIPPPGGMPKRTARPTPYSEIVKLPDGTEELKVTMPGCIFPMVDNQGIPSQIDTLLPEHPIARGIPAKFEIPKTETYGGPFHVPKPDALVFVEHWSNGESFPSGCAWEVGKGRVFYFRPGHETYPIYLEEIPQKIVANAVRWAAHRN
jgi:trehalose utilization protein